MNMVKEIIILAQAVRAPRLFFRRVNNKHKLYKI